MKYWVHLHVMLVTVNLFTLALISINNNSPIKCAEIKHVLRSRST